MSRKIAIMAAVALLASTAPTYAQKDWKIDVSKVDASVRRGELNLGGTDGKGGTIDVNNRYIEVNGKPFIPVSGEFHYNRYHADLWEKEIQKMKAGGITVVSTYVFWNMHEPKEGVFDWSGDLNLRRFVELCGKNDMKVIVRCGPYSHGEVRNGGLPDWLYGRPIEVRSNDPEYLHYSSILYNEIGKQLRGLFYKDGGPIIGIQLDNEYQHAASAWALAPSGAQREITSARKDLAISRLDAGVNTAGNENSFVGEAHMRELRRLAEEAGMVAPLYTATGWGFATILPHGSIPVGAGYAYAGWAPQEPNDYFLYKDIRNHPDYEPVSYATDDYPSMQAEIGTGMMTSWGWRLNVPHESFLPMMVRIVGSGSNGLGYYMYHGGNTPAKDNFFYADGGLNLRSYDYQSPLGEFGQVRGGFYSLKIINSFLRDYGCDLAPFSTVLPDTNPSDPRDLETLRYVVRSDGRSGFVFMHNFQNLIDTKDLKGNSIEVTTRNGLVRFPNHGEFTLKSGVSAMLPFNISFNGVEFVSATIQPFVCLSTSKGESDVFISLDGIAPEIVLTGRHKVSGKDVKSVSKNGTTVVSLPSCKIAQVVIDGKTFLVLPYKDALNAYVVGKQGAQHLVMSSGVVCDDESSSAVFTSLQRDTLSVYPAISELTVSQGHVSKIKQAPAGFSSWDFTLPQVSPKLEVEKKDAQHIVVSAPELDWDGISDISLNFDYLGDRAVCMMDGQVQTDHFYMGKPWTVNIKRFATNLSSGDKLYFYFLPMKKGSSWFKWFKEEQLPDFSESSEVLKVELPEIVVEKKISLNF